MNKKDYVLEILDILNDSWPIAKDLKLLVKNNKFNTKTINIFFDIFQKAINKVDKETKKYQLSEGLRITKKIKEKENNTTKNDQISISRLDNLIRFL